MNWYYADAGRQVGPITDEQLDGLLKSGVIKADTLVWREGMAAWQPYREVRPTPAATTAVAVAPAGGLPPIAAPVGASGEPEAVCAECRRIFPKSHTIQYGTVSVCASCKPMFVQKLKEGATMPVAEGTLNYAGFWIRFGAKLIDGLIFMVVLGIPFFIFMFRNIMSTGPGQPPGFGQLGLQLGAQLVFYVASIGYNTFFLGKFGATPGKMACGLKVVSADGAKITYARSFGRAMAEILSGLICDIGYIIAAFDSQKRALHDHIANTRVIKTR